jgi:hypothetical protein
LLSKRISATLDLTKASALTMDSPKDYPGSKWFVPLVALTLLALTFICFGGNLRNYLFLDDTNAVFAGYLLSSDPGKIFSHHFPYIYGSPIWRYVVALSYIPNYLISGANPWSYYLANLFLHAGSGLLIYLLLARLGKNRVIACLVAVLFTISFQKTDALYWMAARTTMMGCFFYLLTLLFYCRLVDKWSISNLSLCLLAFIAAVGSYEVAFTLPLIMVVTGAVIKGEKIINKRDLLPVILTGGAVAALLLLFKINTSSVGTSVLIETALIPKMLHAFRNIISVFPFFIMPPEVLENHSVAVVRDGYYSGSAAFGWLEYLSLAMLAGTLLLNLKAKNRLIYFALTLFVLTMLPVIASRWNFYPELPYNRMRLSVGRYSYLPSLGFYTITGVYLYQLYEFVCKRVAQKKLVTIIALLCFASFFVLNYVQIQKRKQLWDLVTDMPRQQMAALAQLNLPVQQFKRVAVFNFFNYHIHSLSLFRVLYHSPDMVFTEPVLMRQNPNLKLIGQNRFISAYSDGQDLLLEGN